MHEKNMNFEKIINTSACGNFVVKVPKKVFLDLNRPIRIPFLDSQFEIHEKLKNLMCPLFQLNTKEQSSRLLVEESELEKPILHLSVYGNNFANRCLKRLCLNEELDKKLIAEEISVMTYHKAFQMSHPAMKVQELQNRAQQRKITYLKNVQFPFFSGLTEKMSRYRNSDSTTDGTEKVQTFKQSKNRIQTKQFLNSQSISSANVGLRDDISEENSRNVFSNDLIKLSSKRQWGRHESDSEIPHSLEISLKDNLALSCKSVDLTEEQDDDSVPQEIKRCQPPFDVLQRDSAYGTQSKRTSDGMNEYYESYVKSSKQNYGFSLTEQKFNENAIRCTEESDVPTVHFKHESPLEYDFCRFESDNSENVLQIDPLLAKHLVTSGLPLDAVTLKLNSGQLGTHMVSEDYDTKSASHGLVIELAMQAKFTSLDDEFKELHQSSSGGTSTGRKTGHRPTIHTSIITVDPGCYEKLAEARHTLDTQGLLYPPYARSVIAAADSHLRDFLTCMKNNRLEHHCGLVFKSEEIQSIVNEKNKFRIGHEYKILQQLGAGGHGTALLCACICNDKKSEKPFVVKKIRRDHFHEEEITIPFHHGNMYSHMVEVYGIVLEGEEVSVLMQYAEGGTLKEHRTSSEGNLQHLISPLYRVLKNLSEVHRLGIAHFDIKEENIVFTSKDDPFSATLIDWGSAKIINQTNQKYGNGTRRFYPPEMLQDRTENELDLEKHDVWTVACAFLSNINGAFVFDELWKRCKDRHQMYKQGLLAGHVINEELLKGKHRPSYLLLHLTDLLMSMLDPDVTSRASVSDALSHPVFHCCKYEATAMNELCEESTCSQDTDNNRRLVRVLVHYNKKPIYLNRLCKGYPVKELVRDVGFREKVELRVPQQDIRNGYCLLKNERNVFSIDSDCYLELRPA
ncbi:uncharacterized protein LOC133193342 [Saccostrea echinata]|uniref:uncharacterized protein LOC133193342 n=1 Tax=Saccostrea echinata TaxID=191078 RepID=UPI002A7FF866|nr:uncharacterized protein LOC133193342 [Saccostrea echinata]